MIQADPVKPFNLVISLKKFLIFGPSSSRWSKDKASYTTALNQNEKIVA